MIFAAHHTGGSDVGRLAENPAVLPPGTEQCSLAVDFRRAADERTAFDDVPLPVGLHGATSARRLQFLAGRFCALEALRRLEPRWTGSRIGRAEGGAPVWPAGVVGSITHTDGFVSAAVARAEEMGGLGIDSEGIVSTEQARQVSRLVAWPAELAHARAAGLDRTESLTLVFSAKEAIFKCLHPAVGVMFYYHDARLVDVDAATRTFRARLVKTLSAQFPADTIVEGRFAVSDSRMHTGVVIAA